MRRIGFFHTTSLVIPAVKKALSALRGDNRYYHYLDEGILRAMMEDGEQALVPKVIDSFAENARQEGIDMLIITCSSLSSYLDNTAASRRTGIVLRKIDAAMYRSLIGNHDSIGLVVTNPTTIEPTARLIEQTACRLGRKPQVEQRVLENAFLKLQQGEETAHDRLVIDAIVEAALTSEVIVLAQISIARVRQQLPQRLQSRVFSSLDFLETTISTIEDDPSSNT